MRTKPLAALAALLALPWPALGQVTTVTAPYAEVRSGPSAKFYATQRLPQGSRVTVLYEVKDQPGWLAIVPPPRSFSWVNGKHLKFVDNSLAFVTADDQVAELYPGSELHPEKPNSVSAKLARGTIVEIVGPPADAGPDKLYPVKWHPSEVRYVEAAALQPVAQLATTAPTWNRNAGGVPGYIASLDKASPAPVRPAVVQTVQPAGSASTTSLSPSAPPVAPGTPVLTEPANWSKWGTLRGTTWQVDGQPVYRLEDANGYPLSYVTTPAGKSLRDYVGRYVCIYGPTVYRGDSALRAQYIVAAQVAVPGSR